MLNLLFYILARCIAGKTEVKRQMRKTGQSFMSRKNSVGKKPKSGTTTPDSAFTSKRNNTGIELYINALPFSQFKLQQI